ncbi:5-formyltetrahydrofolate cyclo-ligase [Aureimonas flava]|uniref:5-formyltetrahydrofolate cyclo-ligase n=1 Tax=Aureimonas flava TaxID=2320271 RepID=A0A3A1WNU8_9HYPH|nr:5-formyltetrahydrofolate cyclo-ligase [Aureimonas flava]RIX98760.1 5-formyltetrahydrofolate cyclo-ligase [Aureimonas flava]
MPDIAGRKAELRRDARARREAIAPALRIEAAFALAEHVAADEVFDGLDVVGAYLPIGSEIDPRPAMTALADRRLRLAAPAIVAGELEFRELLRDGELERQGLGTVAPGAGARVLEPDVLLVPLLAFDRRGARIGYGRGFYDRAIARLLAVRPRLVTVGLAFDAQEVDEVPVEPHDRFLDRILTESGVRIPSASGAPR